MSFTVEEFHDLVRLLEQHPEWRTELRRLVLSEELLSPPDLVRELAQAQQRTETQILLLTQAQSDTVERLKRATDQLAAMAGWELERRYRERAASYFGGFLRRIRVVDHQALGLKLDEAQDADLITRQERNEILRLDVVVQGRLDAEETYLAVEVSATVDPIDVRWAAERAELLAKATGERVIAAVAGNEFAGDVAEEAARRKVVCFLDGRLVGAA